MMLQSIRAITLNCLALIAWVSKTHNSLSCVKEVSSLYVTRLSQVSHFLSSATSVYVSHVRKLRLRRGNASKCTHDPVLTQREV